MADHLDAPNLKSPGMNAATDLTDVYAFQKPGDANKTILIMGVNPLAPTLATTFDPNASYEFKIDTNGDAVAEIAFHVMFRSHGNRQQSATVYRATGADAQGTGAVGERIFPEAPASFDTQAHVVSHGDYKFFAGFRSDPFFFDLMGFLNGFKFTGADFFADKNIYAIVLEVPNSALGSNSKIGVWARTMVGTTQIDRLGRPAINTVFNKGDDKNKFNSIAPTQDRAQFLSHVADVLKSFGYSDAKANEIAMILLPDILTYDYSSSAGFLNGRKLTDDVIDAELALVSNGQVTTDKVGAHTDYLSSFPYVGQPHVSPTSMPNTGEGGGEDEVDRRSLDE